MLCPRRSGAPGLAPALQVLCPQPCPSPAAPKALPRRMSPRVIDAGPRGGGIIAQRNGRIAEGTGMSRMRRLQAQARHCVGLDKKAASPYVGRTGISLAELLIVTAIITLILSLVGPVVQQAREAARQSDCSNRLRQLAIAASSYESARGFLPPGNLGNPAMLPFAGNYFTPSGRGYWRRFQYTSGLCLIAGYMEENAVVQGFDPISLDVFKTLDDRVDTAGKRVFDSFLQLPQFRNTAQTDICAFKCPSDRLDNAHVESVYAAIQPVLDSERVKFSWVNLLTETTSTHFGMTNYAGCMGAFGHNSNLSFFGLMPCRKIVRNREVRDGMTRTILLGESLGLVRASRRIGYQNWLVGGVVVGAPHRRYADGSVEKFSGLLGTKLAALPLNFAEHAPQWGEGCVW